MLNLHARAQSSSESEDMFKVVPPSPQAAAFSQYGSHPVNLSTGAVNINIPVYTYTAGPLSVPISLGYNTTGLKVDDTESIVGLGWVLNAGGVITRTILDQPDEEYISGTGDILPYPADVGNSSDWYANYFIDKAIQQPTFDTQPDEYSYNFQGQGGKFIFSREGELLTLPRNNFKITKEINEQGNGDFVVTTPDGIVYHFGGGYEEISYVESAGSTGCPRNFDRHRVTSWYLYEIVHPNGTKIFLEYENAGTYSYVLSPSQSETILTHRTGAGCEPCAARESTNCRSILNVQQSQRLRRIYSPGMGEVLFNISGSNTRFQFLDNVEVRDNDNNLFKKFIFTYNQITPASFHNAFTSTEKRTFLKGFSETNPVTGFKEKAYIFEYESPEQIPPRLTYARDNYGFFNGKDNANLLPLSVDPIFINQEFAKANRNPDFTFAEKGILRSITYPTGGKTTFEYEPHTIYGETIVERKENILLKASPGERVTKSFNSSRDQAVQVRLEVNRTANNGTTWKDTNFYIYEDTNNGKVELFRRQLNEFIPPSPDAPYPDDQVYLEVVDLTLKKNTGYHLEIQFGDGVDMEAISALNLYTGETEVTMKNIEAGGLRIRKMVEDPNSGDPPITKHYDYSDFGTSKSSGRRRFDPRYINGYSRKFTCNSGGGGGGIYEGECFYKTLNGASVGSLFHTTGTHIYYRNVTVGYGPSAGDSYENGKEEITFKIMDDAYANIVRGDEIIDAPLSNFTWGAGLEDMREIYNANDELVKRVTNDWHHDPAGSAVLKGLLVRNQSGPVQRTIDVPCTDANRSEVYKKLTCTAAHSHQWNWGNSGARCVASGASNVWVTFAQHPCYNSPNASETVNYYAYVDLAEYHRRSDWFYNRSVTMEEYFPATGPLVNTTNYYYDNPGHLQLTRTALQSSEGHLYEQHYTYVPDYDESLTAYNIKALKDHNFILPVKTEAAVDGVLISGAITRYNTKGQPVETYKFESDTPVSKPDHVPARYVDPDYHLSDRLEYYNNRLAQVTRRDGTYFSVIWGFNGNYPVAKIDNAGLDVLQGLGISLDPAENISAGDANALYALPGAVTTLYNYQELKGITRITDPNRIQASYLYDPIGRLNYVLDNDQNVSRHLQYGYVTEPLVADYYITAQGDGMYINQPIAFSAKDYPEYDNSLFTYAWSTGGTNKTETLSFDTPGDREVTLSIDYGGKAPSQVTKTVSIINRKPVVDFQVTGDLFVYEELTLDASATYDPDGNSIALSWNHGSTAEVTTVTYNTPGTKSITLTVTDEFGAATTVTKVVDIVNRVPVASFTLSAGSVASGEQFSFDGRASYDPEGSPLSFRWYYQIGSTGSRTEFRNGYQNASWTLDQPGNYIITLEVEDEFGAIGSASKPLEVREEYLKFRGRVVNASGNGVPNIRVNSSTGQHATTNSTGNFEIQTLFQMGNVTIAPAHSTYTFTPSSRTYTDPRGTISGVDFVSSGGGDTGGGDPPHQCDLSVSPGSYTFKADDPGEAPYFSVSTSASSFTVIETSNWVTVKDLTGNGFRITVSGNLGSQRQYQVTVQDSEGCKKYINIVQQSRF
ncbi:PKD domain-containing protein [Fulvivirga kasyanovii]|nr:PKD domain-containing protein [Fulvivirga kasyanovii]